MVPPWVPSCTAFRWDGGFVAFRAAEPPFGHGAVVQWAGTVGLPGLRAWRFAPGAPAMNGQPAI